ncbi:acylphosphatase [Oceanibaculum pacificum]|uniref:acylphosphatase n=1 Tax=Oceanibaculum pacificum TaxID=580166 RepID=A0A154VA48_9PROT|nr:acylphosphatase [Oceanibaculum pacificum]KZC98236.1 acylphosphatase [Oceanibaculum pacificum]
MTDQAVRLSIQGKVQGVWYRAWTVQEATGRGLRGWVRNRKDGSVEAVLVGSPEAVEAMIEACRQGPPAARVSDIEVTATSPADVGPGFAQLPTL